MAAILVLPVHPGGWWGGEVTGGSGLGLAMGGVGHTRKVTGTILSPGETLVCTTPRVRWGGLLEFGTNAWGSCTYSWRFLDLPEAIQVLREWLGLLHLNHFDL